MIVKTKPLRRVRARSIFRTSTFQKFGFIVVDVRVMLVHTEHGSDCQRRDRIGWKTKKFKSVENIAIFERRGTQEFFLLFSLFIRSRKREREGRRPCRRRCHTNVGARERSSSVARVRPRGRSRQRACYSYAKRFKTKKINHRRKDLKEKTYLTTRKRRRYERQTTVPGRQSRRNETAIKLDQSRRFPETVFKIKRPPGQRKEDNTFGVCE